MRALTKLIPFCLLVMLIFAGGCNKTTTDTVAVVSDSVKDDGFVKIFDGETLKDWEGDTTYWRAEGGSLIGEVTPATLLKSNTFIVWQGGRPSDFELKLEFRIAENGNSGINYRSEPLGDVPHALRGYQADIDGKNNYTGQNYEERKRTTLAYRGDKVTVLSVRHDVGNSFDAGRHNRQSTETRLDHHQPKPLHVSGHRHVRHDEQVSALIQCLQILIADGAEQPHPAG